MAAEKANSHRYLWGFAALLLIIVAIWIGWWRGKSSAPQAAMQANGQDATMFRVAGSSMVPTLYGPSLLIKCLVCGHEFLIDLQSLSRAGEEVVCTLCGGRQPIPHSNPSAVRTAYAGDVVRVMRSADNDYKMGELVAVRWAGTLRVKRVAAVGGDEVSLAWQGLLINGQRLEDRLAQTMLTPPPVGLLVDDDSSRTQSRWSCQNPSNTWRRDSQRQWSVDDQRASRWLVYHHRSVHDHDRPSAVMDDYQYNAGVARQLYDVDRLSISGRLAVEQPVTMHAAFWSRDGIVVADKRIEQSGRFEISFYDGVAGNDGPVSKEAPVAIRVQAGPTRLSSLRINRAVEYRLRADDERRQFPMRIPKNHYYLLGDNVPFSVDSRELGSIEAERILGRVEIFETNADDR